MNKLKDFAYSDFNEMCSIAAQSGTDKGRHGYTKLYGTIFEPLKNKDINILEMGIYYGGSLKMWERFFTNGRVFGIDNGRIGASSLNTSGPDNLNPSQGDVNLLIEGNTSSSGYSHLETNRTKCFVADQRSYKSLNEAFEYFNTGEFDIIVDDGHHFMEHQQKSLGILFKHLKPGGYYVIEDICPVEKLLKGSKGSPPEYWGQKKNDCTDSTFYVVEQFINGKSLNSDYISEEQKAYIEENTEDVYMFSGGFYNNNNELVQKNSCLNNHSVVAIFKKK